MLTNVLTLDASVTGLPSNMTVALDARNQIQFGFGEQVTLREPPETRYPADFRQFLYQPDNIQSDDPLYTVQRSVMAEPIANEIDRHGLCYALTALRPGTVSGSSEYVRTRGHTNSLAPGTRLPYPEIHEVLVGEAWLYLQQGTSDHPADIAILPLFAGDKAVVAPGWVSLLVNVGPTPLVIGTWRMSDCRTDSSELLAHGGMAHFVLDGPQNSPAAVANGRYRAVPTPRRIAPRSFPDFGLTPTEPLLRAFHRSPESLRCLLRPQDFGDVWKTIYDL